MHSPNVAKAKTLHSVGRLASGSVMFLCVLYGTSGASQNKWKWYDPVAGPGGGGDGFWGSPFQARGIPHAKF